MKTTKCTEQTCPKHGAMARIAQNMRDLRQAVKRAGETADRARQIRENDVSK